MAWSEAGRFVVLEHDWNGTHWDFMLEAGSGLKTWALSAPIVAGVEIAARMLADHRPVYLSFEGPISGGRGSVRRVAEGTYHTLEWNAEHIRVWLTGDQLVGEVDLNRSASGAESSGGSTTWMFCLGKVD